MKIDTKEQLSRCREKVKRQARAYRDLQQAYERLLRLNDDRYGRILVSGGRGIQAEREARYSRLTKMAVAEAAAGKKVWVVDPLGTFELVKVERRSTDETKD